jgi:flagellar basal body rod protein FlgB
MNIPVKITDNISELLIKVLKFTKLRQQQINENIKNIDTAGYIPKDLPTEEFSDILNNALSEHILNNRLVLIDTENVKFESKGHFNITLVEDSHCRELLDSNRDRYLEEQINKLLENTLNRKLAGQLLNRKQQISLQSNSTGT